MVMRSLCCVAVLSLAGCDAFSGARSKPVPEAVVEAGAAPKTMVPAPVVRPSGSPTSPSRQQGTGSEARGDAEAIAPSPSTLSTPEKGSPERAAILAAIRPWAEAELDQPVIFAIDHLAAKDGYAFLTGRPLQPNGEPIDFANTKFREDQEAGVFGGGLSALVRESGAGWSLVATSLGATDVPWVTWPSEHGAPKEIFPGPTE